MTRIVGRGWATVDLDRAATELAHLVESGGVFEDAARSEWLGARCRIGRATVPSEAPFIVLMEPDTEGRLAAFLARHGEGWAASWTLDVRRTGKWRPGPLGPDQLAADQPPRGSFLLFVTTATIEP